jgi:methionyl-tRNA formyltransferase
MTRAVVFAYHNVGYQCLSILLKQGIEVALVVTHTDNPAERIWFDSVAALCREKGIAAITPADPNTPEVLERVRALKPDFIFSFYYRNMLKQPLLDCAARGALNMHGSLLPKYRGRVPVNWAVINGETETGATLHYMTAKPDAGDIVGQQPVAILPDETAADVFRKVTAAAGTVLDRSLPGLVAGSAPRIPQDLAAGSYYGGRTPADGRIDWNLTAARVHDLVRGVAPPYPGAFTVVQGDELKILRTQLQAGRMAWGDPPALYASRDSCFAVCADSTALRILEMEFDGKPFTPQDFLARFGENPVSPDTQRQPAP